MEMDELQLTDLIDRDVLQKMQEGFVKMTGIAAITTDADGVPVTEWSNFTDFCMNYTRKSLVGCKRCEECNIKGAREAKEKGSAAIYTCHGGLVNIAAPIVADNRIMGSIIGGQVLAGEPDLEQMRKTAGEIGVDPEEYLAAAGRVKRMERDEIENAADFLYTFAEVLSNMANNKYLVHQANIEIEQSGNMKSDFLANMSHEIRTPMNAVIGMAEMALREELTSVARDYINQIKEAGKSLLTIINDILDFSKIESGKMDINVVDYEPMSMVHDVANIVMTRLKEKDVELILAVAPNLPNKLLGDNIRIKQVLLNIANNAAKFTNTGQIVIKMDYASTAPGEIELHIAVEDTGIGIKEEDIGKLFQSFQQLDSKRNRNIEGTGLGLAISKQLLTLMDGNIWIESEYERGSKFSFVLPQKVVDETPSIRINDPSTIVAAGLISNPYVRESLYSDIGNLGVECIRMQSARDLSILPQDKKLFLFVESPMFTIPVEEYVRNHPEVTAVVLIDFFDNVKYNIPNVIVIKKPVFALNIAMILNGEELHFDDNAEGKEFDFIAPDAEILIVDDNTVNLTVAVGLLEPLKMKIDTAVSGKAAIEMIGRFHYDIVFMDHMMPELDGVETTHIIRRFHPEYDDVPIIALTANAVEGTKEMFCREGMNDFVAKPIEIRMLVSKVKQWLPNEKIQRVSMTQGAQQKSSDTEDIVVGDLDVPFALKFLGSEELFWTVLKVYYRTIEKKAKLIKSLEEQEDWPGYTIEVHALKSSSKQIGAVSLSEKAAAMEKAGNARDSALIHRRTDEMLEQYIQYISVLEPFCQEEKEEAGEKKGEISIDVLIRCFTDMRLAVDNLDMDKMEEVIHEMNQYSYSDWQQEMLGRLGDAVEEMDVDNCEAILQEWENGLSK